MSSADITCNLLHLSQAFDYSIKLFCKRSTVRSSVSYSLASAKVANVENLVLTGATNIDATGDNFDNRITGNSGNNILSGRRGNDTLTGGGGNDGFLFDQLLSVAGLDSITDFVVGNDKILLNTDVFQALETGGGYVPGKLFPPTPLLATDFSVISVVGAAEQVAAATSSNEIVYNRVTGNLFYNANNNAAGFGTGGGRFATIVGSPDNLSNTNFLLVPSPPFT